METSSLLADTVRANPRKSLAAVLAALGVYGGWMWAHADIIQAKAVATKEFTASVHAIDPAVTIIDLDPNMRYYLRGCPNQASRTHKYTLLSPYGSVSMTVSEQNILADGIEKTRDMARFTDGDEDDFRIFKLARDDISFVQHGEMCHGRDSRKRQCQNEYWRGVSVTVRYEYTKTEDVCVAYNSKTGDCTKTEKRTETTRDSATKEFPFSGLTGNAILGNRKAGALQNALYQAIDKGLSSVKRDKLSKNCPADLGQSMGGAGAGGSWAAPSP